MRLKFLCLIFIILVMGFSCTGQCERSDTKTQEIKFYAEGETGIDNYYVYQHYLILTNYVNNTMEVKDFIKLAQNYIDTAKADKPIEQIIFLGEPPGECIPFIGNDSREDEKYNIISIGFESADLDYSGDPKDLRFLYFWSKGKRSDILYINNPTVRDSIFKSNKKLNNNNN